MIEILIDNYSDTILQGILLGCVVICLITLIKSAITLLTKDTSNKHIDAFLRTCDSCLSFWVTLTLTFDFFVASIGWVIALFVVKLKD